MELAGTEQIRRLEQYMVEQPQADCPVRHIFAPGIYVRELRMAAGTLAIGHHQRTRHLNNFIAGKVRMADGTLLEAPMTFIGEPGRKCGLVLEDVVWQNVYATDETDIEKLEEMFLDKSKSLPVVDSLALEYNNSEDREDFQAMLDELGVSAETVRAMSENTEDRIPFPFGVTSVQVAASRIEGRGLFATENFHKGDVICISSYMGKRTPAGRYTNHAKSPNAKMVVQDGMIIMVALRDINGCRGTLVGEEITVDYRDSVRAVRRMLCQE